MRRGLAFAAVALAVAVGSAPRVHAGELANRLAGEASPFLRAHATQAIPWQPHDEAAFAAAVRLDRPLFVHVGYATCSGCLRMNEETFPDPEVAAALEAGFVPVMVDRDARPELADVYARMAAAMGTRVGYPLHLFLLPDGSPFHAATFLPRHDRPGEPGVLTVLASVTRALAGGRDALVRRGAVLRETVAREIAVSTPARTGGPDPSALLAVVASQRADLDPTWGGLRALPKRPVEPSVPLLLRYARRSGDREAQKTALRGLERMVAAPIRAADGGFHEAAGQADWSAPVGEERLADNARLALAYLEAWQVSGEEPYGAAARGVLDFLVTRLGSGTGGFVAARSGERVDAQEPTAGQGLALSALARLGFALEIPPFLEAAQVLARHLLESTRGPGGLPAFVANGRRGPPATLDDHALVIAGLLDLLEADPNVAWLDGALALAATQEADFAHPGGGYFLTREAPGPGLPRPVHARDGALPSGQGVAALNLLRLHALTGDEAYRERADRLLAAFSDALQRDPRHHATLAIALDARLDGLREIAVALAPGDRDSPLVALLRRTYLPNRVLVIVEGTAPEALATRAPLLEGKRPLGGSSTVFVCQDHVCAEPARDRSTLVRQLGASTPIAKDG